MGLSYPQTLHPRRCAKTQRAVLSLTFLIHGSRAAQLTGQQEEAALYIRTVQPCFHTEQSYDPLEALKMTQGVGDGLEESDVVGKCWKAEDSQTKTKRKRQRSER